MLKTVPIGLWVICQGNFTLLHPPTFCYHGERFFPMSTMISIDEFRKLDLKVATVKKVEPHPNADKLLVLYIDLGSEERQIVAGIKGHYAPEELVGKQIVVVGNLETAKLRGVDSQGMLLAASDGDRIVILTPEKKVTPGAKIS